MTLSSIEIPWRCPTCHSMLRKQQRLACSTCGGEAQVVGRLIDFSALTPKLDIGLTMILQSVRDRTEASYSDGASPRLRGQLRKIERYARGGMCVEIGPATGLMTSVLEDMFDHVIALEHSRALLQRAVDRTRSATCVLGDAHFVPLGDAFADFVVCTEVLEHVVVPTQLLLEMRRILKRDGLAFIAVPNEQGLNPFPLMGHPHRIDDTHVNFYRPTTLARALVQTGFDVVRMSTSHPRRGWLEILRRPKLLLEKLPALGHRIECLARPAANPVACWEGYVGRRQVLKNRSELASVRSL